MKRSYATTKNKLLIFKEHTTKWQVRAIEGVAIKKRDEKNGCILRFDEWAKCEQNNDN